MLFVFQSRPTKNRNAREHGKGRFFVCAVLTRSRSRRSRGGGRGRCFDGTEGAAEDTRRRSKRQRAKASNQSRGSKGKGEEGRGRLDRGTASGQMSRAVAVGARPKVTERNAFCFLCDGIVEAVVTADLGCRAPCTVLQGRYPGPAGSGCGRADSCCGGRREDGARRAVARG